MTIDERHLHNARIAELLHFALVRIRGFTFPAIPNETDRREEINDLADLLHNLPRYTWGTTNTRSIRPSNCGMPL